MKIRSEQACKGLLLALLITNAFASATGQCNNTTNGGSMAAPVAGGTVSASSSAQQYLHMTGAAANWDYTVSSSKNTDFITVRQGTPGGPVVAFGTQPLDWVSSVAGTYYIHCNTNSSCGTSNTSRTISLTAAPAMAYSSGTTAQASTANAVKCDLAAKEVLRLEVVTIGSMNPISATQFTVRTNGSSAPLADLANIRIYYTGTSSTFSTASLFGTAAPAAIGTNITVSGAQALAEGTNYFWVAYDLAPGAAVNDLLHGQCMSMTVGGSSRTPSVTDPAGSRTIKACPPSPGGVWAGILLWLRPDAGVTTSGANVTGWSDQSMAGSSTTVNGSPDKVAVGRNFNPVIQFTMSDGANGGDFLKLPNMEVQSYFLAAQLSNVSRPATHIVTYDGVSSGLPCAGCAPHGGGDGTPYAEYGQVGYGRTKFQSPGVWRRNGDAAGISYNTRHSGNFDLVSALGTGTAAVNTVLGGQNSLGSFNGRTRDWLGPVGEVVLYGGALPSADVNRVESYLALKYGITLGGNGSTTLSYSSSAGTVIWPSNSGFHRDVIGIGRDDSSDLLQKQSRTEDDSARFFVGTLAASNQANTGSISSDGAFIMAGHNGGKLCATYAALADQPAGLYSRLERKWKVVNTGFSGSFSFSVRINNCGAPALVNPADLRLLVSTGTTFSGASVVAAGGGLSFSYSGGIITVSGISTAQLPANSVRYITIGSVSNASPLPVTLVDFNATCGGQGVEVAWSTASEQDNAGFTVEASTDGTSFNAVGTVPGAGMSSTMRHYSWTGGNPMGSLAYYRLKQTDLDGLSTYSPVVPLHCGSAGMPVLYPNPARSTFWFTMPGGAGQEPLQVEMRNTAGQVVWRRTFAVGQAAGAQEVNFGKVPEGLYFVTFIHGAENTTIKLSVAE